VDWVRVEDGERNRSGALDVLEEGKRGEGMRIA
jgi:hypothetical protein